MNVPSEKLRLIEWLVGLQDQKVLGLLNKLREASETAAYEAALKPMSVDELVARAEASAKAIQEGRVSDIEAILEEDWD